MNKWTKAMAVATAAALIGFGGWATTSANAATDDEIATYLAEAVATQLGIPNSDALRQLIADAMANNLIDPTVTDAAGMSVDGMSTLTPEELAALLDSNLTQQLSAIEQALLDLGVTNDPEVPDVTPKDEAYEDEDEAYEDEDEAYEDEDEAYEEEDESDDVDDADEVEDEDESDDADEVEDEDEVDEED
jgi:hypothetical protein